MNKDSDKTKEQLLADLSAAQAELTELRKKSKEQEDKLKASNQQLDEHNQQLLATEQQLRAANQQLEASNKEIKEHAHKLGERVKELNCLHSISEAVRTRETMEEILQDVTEVIPPSWQYPQITGSKITLWDKKYKTENHKDSEWKLSSDIKVNKKVAGKIEVCYLEKKPESDIGPFLNEERILLDDIAERLGRIIERKNAEKALKATNQQLRAANQQLEENNRQLRATEQQLRAANQQLEASNIEISKRETEVLAAKEYAEDIIETLREPLLILDEDLKVITANASYYKTFKVSQKDTEGKFVFELGNNQWDIPELKKLLLEILPNKSKIVDYEVEHLFKDIGQKTMLLNAKELIQEQGKAKRILLSIEDITERKRAEKELIKLSTAVTQSPSVIAITDTDGNIEYANPKFTKLTGYSRKEVIGQNLRVLKSGEQSDKFYKKFWETISSGKVWRGEFHNKKKNGELFWESASISPIFDEQGKIINYIKVAEDITERKQAEDNFKHSIDESPLGIRIVNQAGKTVYVNKALMDIYEFSSLDEFNNTKVIDRYTGKSYQEHLKRKKIRQEGGDDYDYEISIRRKNGEIRHIKVWRKEVIWNRKKHFQVINQDITELKRLYTDLILAKEKAEESDRLKSAFLANMSHEIRTPMNGILGFSELLKEPQLTGDEKDEFIRLIEKSGKRMLNTINDIIDISKIEAGQVKVVKSEISINKLLEEQYNFFYNEAQSKGLELNYKPSLTDSESRIITDKHKLEGILTNLIKNAIKFTGQGKIEFGCHRKKEKEKGKEFLEFYVTDTGIGIPANRVDAVFNRFEQADIEDTRVIEGSGLGLAIAKSYVEMLGGKISVKSKEGEGSTFTFSIPYTKQFVKESVAQKNITKKAQTSIRNLTVLIAEDEEVSQLYLKTILENEVNKLSFTSNGRETIDKCRENPDINIILMDIKMPDMNGYDTTREIRKFNNDVIIIAQTAFGLSGDREKALEAGCNDYIAKPIKKDELIEKISICLNKKRI